MAVIRRVGHPPKYHTARELSQEIEKYFETDEIPTLAGLAVFLGFCDRQSLYDQGKRGEEYSCVIKNTRTRLEAFHERGLYGRSPAGHIFWLKNHAGYVDAQSVSMSGADGGPFGVYMLSRDEAMARLAELREKQDAQ